MVNKNTMLSQNIKGKLKLKSTFDMQHNKHFGHK